MTKITIIGPSGSGKSTLAKQLGDFYEVPVIHLDSLYFNPNWQEIGKTALLEKVTPLIHSTQHWIIEGNYSITWPIRFNNSDTIIFLDFSRFVYIRRILKRSFIYHGKVRPDMADGCPERFNLDFLRFAWNYPTRRKETLKQLAHIPKEKILTFHHPTELKHYLASLMN
ncbi:MULTISPECIES: topology modulation protein [Carnobacterium]|uniref:Topology modulation protein n=1 Tax=Carnobacterium divergens TaxID=2748 RepID=A0A2R7ZY53_CARDV|nr:MULTISPECIES: topology modulation protein [Carnobacterium]MCO6018521.1 AAA family ATPase [Carnobacterium divergens]MDT1939831.1 AAA family ATPase [Carnobacterium divergens]MDT1942269.1 AAA family ATPase [Carnobacterium divergens]MDT1948075.1 AAA family ATPase [Carnobacterium divergens]MDT1950555.1 AAA family ATPase [Carnobacterium divergens]